MRLLAVASIIASLTLLWFVADNHYQGCVDRGRVSCSVLPWDQGEAKPDRRTDQDQIRDALDELRERR